METNRGSSTYFVSVYKGQVKRNHCVFEKIHYQKIKIDIAVKLAVIDEKYRLSMTEYWLG